MNSEGSIGTREMQKSDIPLVVNYFLNASEEELRIMGAESSKLPSFSNWTTRLEQELALPIPEKTYYYIIWLKNNLPIGHSNINEIKLGEEAYMHLHLWASDLRQKGLGNELMKLTIHEYFKLFALKRLYCQPKSDNPAPNKTLRKLGFDYIESIDCRPGWINFYQTVNKYVLTLEKAETLLL